MDTSLRAIPDRTSGAVRREATCRRTALVLGLVVAGVGLAVLASWRSDVEWPRSIVPGWATMKPNTSLSMLCLGTALTCVAAGGGKRVWTWAARLAALPALAVGVLTTLSHAGFETPGLDTLLATPGPTVYPSGRMSPVTSVLIALLSLGVLVSTSGSRSGRIVAWLHRLFAGAACGLALASITGYMFGPESLYSSPGFETIAVHSAFCGIAVAVGLLFLRPDLEPLRSVLAETAAGACIRAGVPLALLALVVVHVVAAVFFRLRLASDSVLFGLELVAQLAIVGLAFGLSARAVERSAAAADTANAAVRRSETKYRAIWDAAPVLVWACDERGRGDYFNQAWMKFVGSSPESQMGEGWTTALHPDDRAAFLGKVGELHRSTDRFQMECRARRHDGEWRWLLISAVRTEGHGTEGVGARGCLGTCIDITESRRMSDRQSMLMRELDHRVKNNLAAVASVAELTFVASPDSDTFRHAFQGRLAAMGRAHSALAAGRWTGLSLDALVRTVLRPVMGLDSNPVVIDGPPVSIPQQGVPALAMALHELTTNAQKYGALSVPGGQVSVRWVYDPASERRNTVEIRWQERGGPPPRSQPQEGLGLNLLRGFVESELAGTLSTDFDPAGFMCIMRLRIDAWDVAEATGPDSQSPKQERQIESVNP